MNEQIRRLMEAKALLQSESYTLVAISETKTITETERGVKPLLQLLKSNQSLHGFSVADKVIGKAASFLYILLQPDRIHTIVISRPALQVLQQHQIPVTYDTLTEAIRNRQDTGFCPMETAVMDAATPMEALQLIEAKLHSLNH